MELVPPGDRLWAFAFRPDGKALAALVGLDKLFVWDELHPGQPPRSFKLSGQWVASQVVFHPDGQRVALTIWKQAPSGPVVAVELIETATGTVVQSFSCSPSAKIAFSPDGKQLAATDARGVLVWDVHSSKLVSRFPQEPSPTWIAFRPDGRQLAASSPDGKLYLWDLLAPADAPQRTLTLTPVPGRSRVAYSANGRYLITFNSNNTLYVLRLAPRE
jgi:WD40 repeat protein